MNRALIVSIRSSLTANLDARWIERGVAVLMAAHQNDVLEPL